MINWQWIRTYCTLIEVGHFTRTAERLHMTQSGVSQQIKKLEDHFGQVLLLREGKGFCLTEAGEQVYREGLKLLRSLSELEQQVGQDDAYEGLVRLASPGSIGLKLYPQLLLLQQKFPRLIIDFRFAPNDEVARLIEDHKVDIGFMTDVSYSQNITVDPLSTEELQLVTPAATKLSDWKTLSTLGYIDHPDGQRYTSKLLSINYSEFQHINQFQRTGFSNQIHLILEPVSLGLGFTVLPNYAIEVFSKPEKIRVHHLPKRIRETVYAGRYLNRTLPKRVNTVLDLATDLLGN